MNMNRREFFTTAAAAAVTAAFAPVASAIERDWSGQIPVRYPDPSIVSLDGRFNKYRLWLTPIQRLYTGTLWAEGPCWFGDGRFLIFSDIPNNRIMRWTEETGTVSVFRKPSNHTNGNTRDWQGRLISCEHSPGRVSRTEYDGSTTVLADSFQGKRLNAPNDAVAHPDDGGIWFTDPGYGSHSNYEGKKRPLELPTNVYRIDPQTGKMDAVTDELGKPNGLCFSPDYEKLYIADTGASHIPDHPKEIRVYDVVDGNKLRNGRTFADMTLDGVGAGFADGIRCDVDGNIWSSAGWVGEGYDGVHIFAPNGDRIGQILLPEVCSNVCFGGRNRNRLFMTGSQSLYAFYVKTQGAHIA